jgi:23S rRNA (guanosine2251-2'-O)-methyltransferase
MSRGRGHARRRPRGGGESKRDDGLVVGRHAVLSAMEHAPEIAQNLYVTDAKDDVAAFAKAAGINVNVEKKTGLDSRAGSLVHQGYVLSTSGFPYSDLEDVIEEEHTLLLALDGVEDPRNLGAAARAAHALGATAVIVPRDRAARVTASAHKTAAGALFRLRVVRADNFKRALERLKEAGVWVVGAEADADETPWQPDLTEPTCLVVGGEDRGLRRLTREACDRVVSIPMAAGDVSLNAADAATVLLYEARRQRLVAGSNSA